MSCGHCRATVEKALRGVPGTLSAAVDLADGSAQIDFDPLKASAERYVEAVRAAGYDARAE